MPLVAILMSGFASHAYCSMGLARRLQAMGFRVEYWGENSVQQLVRRQGFTHRELSPLLTSYERILRASWKELMRTPRDGISQLLENRARRRDLVAALSKFERSLEAHLARETPTLVLLDSLAVAYYPLLKTRGLNCVVVQDKPWSGFDPLAPPPTSSYVPKNTAMGRFAVRMLWAREAVREKLDWAGNAALGALGFYTHHLLVAAIRARSGVARSAMPAHRRVSYDLYFDGLTEWLFGAPDTDLPRHRPLPEHVRFVGPCVDTERVQFRSPVPRKHEACRLVYVAMGVSQPHWRSDLSLLRRMIDALQDVPGLQLVISTGNLQAHKALRHCAANVHVAAFLPQISILETADLAVTHAGANTFRECVATRTPMLVFPRDYDQHGNAARIVRLGMGLRGNRWDGPAQMRRQVMHLLDERHYGSRVAELRERVQRAEHGLLTSALQAALRSSDIAEPDRLPAVMRGQEAPRRELPPSF